MKGFWYQLKLTAKDKMSVLTLLLPLLLALALVILQRSDLSGVTAYRFVVREADGPAFVVLAEQGKLRQAADWDELVAMVNDPRDDTIGILQEEAGYRLVLSGDERSDALAVARAIPELLSGERQLPASTSGWAEEVENGLLNPILSMLLVTALFLGLTFTTLNLVSEKEDGVELVIQVTPLSPAQYLRQKIMLGFGGGLLLGGLTVLLCVPQPLRLMPLIPLFVCSALTIAVWGLFLGQLSTNLMVAIVWVKSVMILLIAVPLAAWMLVPETLQGYFLLLPSYPLFSAVLKVLQDEGPVTLETIAAAIHSVFWLAIYLVLRKRRWGRIS